MIISCSACGTRYVLDPAKLGAAGRTVRCANCHHSWFQEAPDANPMVTRIAPRPAVPASGVARTPARGNRSPLEGAGTGPASSATAPPNQDPPRAAKPEPTAAEAPSQPLPQSPAPPGVDERIAAIRQPDPATAAPPPRDAGFERHLGRAGAREHVRNLPALPRQRSNTALVAGWTALLFLVLGVVGNGFFFFREAIAERLPASRKIYDAIGLELAEERPDPVRALRIVTPQPPPARSLNGVLTQDIAGTVENDTEHRLAVPLLRGVLFDELGNEIYSWTFRASATSLGPRQVASFETDIFDMPDEASRVEVMFDSYYRARKRQTAG
ncbi:MAG: zinc-ribbon domain-containing protein [Sphingomonadales bacterium]